MGEAGGLLFKGHSSRLQLLIEKIQANKENHNVTEQELKDALGTEGVSSWTGSEGQSSPPSSCATPNSATELADSELAFTVGVTEATPYACQFCDKAFPRLSYLKKHEQTHSDHLPFICEFCKRRFKHKRSKDRHLKLHTGDKRYKCSQCQAAFARSDHLKIHMKTHDNQKPFQCTICNRGYNTAAALTSHMQNHKKTSEPDSSPSGSTFKCLECSEMFSKPELLTNHMMTEHQGNISKKRASPSSNKLGCMYCTKDNFSSLEALQLHIQAMHGSILKASHRYGYAKGPYPPNGLSSSGYACRLCTMVFPSSMTLQAHAAVAHGIQETGTAEEHQCPQCSLSFRSLSSFAEHFIVHHGALPGIKVRPTKPPSDQVLPTDLSVVRKEQSLENPPAVKRSRSHSHQVDPSRNLSMVQYDHPGILLCNQCNAALPDFESFRSHLKSHLEESTYSPIPPPPPRLPQMNICTYCGAHLGSPEELTRHIATHFLSTITEYGCQSCYQLFPKPEDLQKHLLDKHAQHWYRCTLCKELFESQSAIQVHFAVKHCSETKQYKCAACPNAPSLHSELEFSLHVRAVHSTFSLSPNPPPISSPRLHRCLFCNLTFSSEMEMQFHLTVHTKLFQCPLCSESFHVEYFLEKHMQMCHPNQNTSARVSTYEKEVNDNDAPLNGYHPPPTSLANFGPTNNSGHCPPDGTKRNDHSSHHHNNNNNCSSNNNNIPNTNNNNNNNLVGVCDICESGEFASEAELNAHRKLVHHLKTSSVTKVSLHCAYCKESCKSRTELENHMKSYCQAAMGSSKHKCNICDEMCLSAAILAEHKLTHCKVVHGSTCTHCKALIVNEESFISHSIQHSTASSAGNGHQQLVLPNACVICRQTLTSEMETRLHAKFHLQTEVSKCSICLQSYDRSEVVDGVCKGCHKRARSSPCVCVQCHLQFESTSALELHMAKAHKKSFKCSKCKEMFVSERDFENHCTHACGGDNVFKCCLCLLLFPGPNQLQAHLIEHTFAGCPNFTCYICSAVFTTSPALQTHILEHGLSARPYDCSKCSQKFFFRAELENHSFVHAETLYLNEPRTEKHFLDRSGSLFKVDPDGKDLKKKQELTRTTHNGLNLIKYTKAESQEDATDHAGHRDGVDDRETPDTASEVDTLAVKTETQTMEINLKSVDLTENAENGEDILIKSERE